MKIIIPILGRGSKFIQAGIAVPKPLITVRGKFIFQWAVEAISYFDLERDSIFIIHKEHVDKWEMDTHIRTIVGKKTHIEIVDFIPQGAAKTVMLFRSHIDTAAPLIIYNADQYFTSDFKNFLRKNKDTFDGIIPYFYATHPKWSYVGTDSHDIVHHVAEKEVISNKATVGLYYFKHGRDFVTGADAMIKKQIMVANEYYVCPVYNELIEAKKKIKALPVLTMWSLGTPEDVEKFEKYFKEDL